MIRVGLIDSGLDPLVLAAGATLVGGGETADPHGHGSALSRLLATTVDPTRLACAPVFDRRGLTSPAQVAEALEHFSALGVEMVVMALGLAHDRAVLAEACRRAVAADLLLVASAPARGTPCYPAAYDGVISVCGDARCRPGQVSWFGGAPALFGACVLPPQGSDERFRGASMAAGHFAAWVWQGFPDRRQRCIAALAGACHFHGRERRAAQETWK